MTWRGGLTFILPQSDGAVEYPDYIAADGLDSPNECPGYDTKQSDDEASVMLELWRMQSTSLPILLGPFWPGVVAPGRVLPIGQIELFDI